MKIIVIILIIYSFLKSISYGNYEKNKKQNKLAYLGVYFVSILGLLIPFIILIIWY